MTLPIIDASLNKIEIVAIEGDLNEKLDVSYNITNLINNQNSLIGLPPTNSGNYSVMKLKLLTNIQGTNDYYVSGDPTINGILISGYSNWQYTIFETFDGYFINNKDKTLNNGNKIKIQFSGYGGDTIKLTTDINTLPINEDLYFTKLNNYNENLYVSFRVQNDNGTIIAEVGYTDGKLKLYNSLTNLQNNSAYTSEAATGALLNNTIYRNIINNFKGNKFLDISSNILYDINAELGLDSNNQNIVKIISNPSLPVNELLKFKFISNNYKLNNPNGIYEYTANTAYIGQQKLSVSVPLYGISGESLDFVNKELSFNVSTNPTPVPLPVIDASLNKTIIVAIQNDPNEKLDVSYNITNLYVNNQSSFIGLPPTNSGNYSVMKLKLQTNIQGTNNYYVYGNPTINGLIISGYSTWDNTIFETFDGYFINNRDTTINNGNKIKIQFSGYGGDTIKLTTDINTLPINEYLFFTKLNNYNENLYVSFRLQNDNGTIIAETGYTDGRLKLYNSLTNLQNSITYNTITSTGDIQGNTIYRNIINNFKGNNFFDITSNILYDISAELGLDSNNQHIIKIISNPSLPVNELLKFKFISNNEKISGSSGIYEYTANPDYTGQQKLSVSTPLYGISGESLDFVNKELSFFVSTVPLMDLSYNLNYDLIMVNNTLSINYQPIQVKSGIISFPGTSKSSFNTFSFTLQNTTYTIDGNIYNKISSSPSYNTYSIPPSEWNLLEYINGVYLDVSNNVQYTIIDIKNNSNTCSIRTNPILPYQQNQSYKLYQMSNSVNTIVFNTFTGPINWEPPGSQIIPGSLTINNIYLDGNMIDKLKYLNGSYLDLTTKLLYDLSFSTLNNTIIVYRDRPFTYGKTYTLTKMNTNEKLNINPDSISYQGSNNFILDQDIKISIFNNTNPITFLEKQINFFVNPIFQQYVTQSLSSANLSALYNIIIPNNFNSVNASICNDANGNIFSGVIGTVGNDLSNNCFLLKKMIANPVVEGVDYGYLFSMSKLIINAFPSTVITTGLNNSILLQGINKTTIDGSLNKLSIESKIIDKTTALINNVYSNSSSNIPIFNIPTVIDDSKLSIESNFYSGLTTGFGTANKTALFSAKITNNMLEQGNFYLINVSDVENDLRVGMESSAGAGFTITSVIIEIGGIDQNVPNYKVQFQNPPQGQVPGSNTTFTNYVTVDASSNCINIVKLSYCDTTQVGNPIAILTYSQRFTNGGVTDRYGEVGYIVNNSNYIPTIYHGLTSTFRPFTNLNSMENQTINNNKFYYYNDILARQSGINNIAFNSQSFNKNMLGSDLYNFPNSNDIQGTTIQFITGSLLQKSKNILSRIVNTNNGKTNFSGKRLYQTDYNSQTQAITTTKIGDVLTNQGINDPNGYNFYDGNIHINNLYNAPYWVDVDLSNNGVNGLFKLKTTYGNNLYSKIVNNYTKGWGDSHNDDFNNNLYFITLDNSNTNIGVLDISPVPTPYNLGCVLTETTMNLSWKSISTLATSYKLVCTNSLAPAINLQITVPATIEELQTYNLSKNDIQFDLLYYNPLIQTSIGEIKIKVYTYVNYTEDSNLGDYTSPYAEYIYVAPPPPPSDCPCPIYFKKDANQGYTSKSTTIKNANIIKRWSRR
jgi:hypothetical protein